MKRFWLAPAGAAGAGVALGLYSRFLAPRRLEVVREEITVGGLPAALDGMRIGVVGDIHLGRKRGRKWTSPALDSAVAAIRDAEVDLLALVGDYGFLGWEPDDLAEAVDRFDAPLRLSVLGNHDFAKGSGKAKTLRHALESRGITVLVNEAIDIQIRDETITVAGLGDYQARRADIDATVLAIHRTAGDFSILLSHTPDGVPLFPPQDYGIALAGHTHGGQIAIPFLRDMILLRFAKTRFDRGIYDVGGRPLFITKGVGMVGHRARFNARPDVAILTLSSQPG